QSSVYSSKFRILQLLCFHTLLKTAGVYCSSSQNGTLFYRGPTFFPFTPSLEWRLHRRFVRGFLLLFRTSNRERSTADFLVLLPFACPLFSTTSNNQISELLCFDNDAKCPRGVGGIPTRPYFKCYFNRVKLLPQSGLLSELWNSFLFHRSPTSDLRSLPPRNTVHSSFLPH